MFIKMRTLRMASFKLEMSKHFMQSELSPQFY